MTNNHYILGIELTIFISLGSQMHLFDKIFKIQLITFYESTAN